MAKSLYQPVQKVSIEGVRKFMAMAMVAMLSLFAGYHIGVSNQHISPGLPHTQISSKCFTDSNSSNSRVYRKINSDRRSSKGVVPDTLWQKQADLYKRRLHGKPEEDLPEHRPRYLAAFAVGLRQKKMLNKMLDRFPLQNFTLILFHYDGSGPADWEEYEWARRAVHVAAKEQSKWWFAKRFLHPDVVAPYEYVFLWDDDLIPGGGFNAEEYVKVAMQNGLEISQPAMGVGTQGVTWMMTLKRRNSTVHRLDPYQGWCPEGPLQPPCGAFVEIMAPVFSKKAWRCVWEIVQSDLVHGWGLDFAMRRCVGEPPHMSIGIIDSHWVVHPGVTSLGKPSQEKNVGSEGNWTEGRAAMRERCFAEWDTFKARLNGTATRNLTWEEA